MISPDSAIDPLVTSQSGVRCKRTDVSHLVVKLHSLYRCRLVLQTPYACSPAIDGSVLTVDEIPGGDGGHSQEDEGSLADAGSTSDSLAYGQKYVKKQKRKRKVPKWLDHYVGSGEVEGELSSVVGEEIVDETLGGDGGHSQEDEGSLADA